MKKNKKEKHQIKQEVLKTLQSLDRLDKVNAMPFFYKRVMQKLEYPATKGVLPTLQSAFARRLQPMLVPLSIAVSIAFGIIIGYSGSSESRSKKIEYFASAYGIEAPNLNNYQLLMEE